MSTSSAASIVCLPSGPNIGTPASDVPDGGFTWHKTWQPVVTDLWRTDAPPADEAFTTVMTWKIESFADVDGNKDKEFIKFIDLPSGAARAVPPGVAAIRFARRQWPADLAAAIRLGHGGRDGCLTFLWDYRDFIQGSNGEFGVAKNAYVANRSGWFSDRTECYLAAGRPAIVQDTGWSAHLPHGTGLIPFSTPEEAIEGLARVSTDWATHSQRASEIAREYFDSGVILPRLIDLACR